MSVLDQLKNKRKLLIMGILNVTPDSFSDGGKFNQVSDALQQALDLEENGADIIDIGGESTRPGAKEVPVEEEINRTIPVIKEIRRQTDVPISIDTRKSKVANAALDAGANIINDISALRTDPALGKVAASSGVPLVLMHMQGTPETMQQNPSYDDVIDDIINFLRERIEVATEMGVSEDKIVIDPGIGFGKTTEDNYEILRRLDEFNVLDRHILLGTSRKSFLGATLDLPVDKRLEGTIASNVVGIIKGADIIRVHDVKEMYRAAQVAVRCI